MLVIVVELVPFVIVVVGNVVVLIKSVDIRRNVVSSGVVDEVDRKELIVMDAEEVSKEGEVIIRLVDITGFVVIVV